VIIAESNGEVRRKKASYRMEEMERTAGPTVEEIQRKEEQKKFIKTAPYKEMVLHHFIENKIRETLAGVLRIDMFQFDLNTPFSEFGVDSILGVGIINKLNGEMSINLSTPDIFNYSTIRTLTDHIEEKFGFTVKLPSDEDISLSEKETLLSGEFSAISKVNQNACLNVTTDAVQTSGLDIAIIGMAGRFPDAVDIDGFWCNLENKRNSVKEIKRWNFDNYYGSDPTTPNKSYSKWAGLLSGIEKFDPLFFNISPKEAEYMDPQQRLFLEEAWKALEVAGYSDRELEGKKCGVFVGCGVGDYRVNFERSNAQAEADAFIGNNESILASRISYFLNLKGPSIALNTSCSSSLVAVHLACESIQCGTSDMALAGGVSLLTTPAFHIMASRAGMLSPDGRCKTFDNNANGFVPGEGVGAVVLKSLKAALRDGDHI
jgi:acyl carrier protein